MQTIDRVWREQIAEFPTHTDFDLEFAKANSYPSLDAVSEAPLRETRWQWQRNLDDLVPITFGFMLWCPVVIVLANRKLRIALIGLLFVSSATYGVLFAFEGTILRYAFPPTYRFYGDFAYVTGPDWATGKEQLKDTIIAYEVVPSRAHDYREALLMDGSVTILHKDCIAMLLIAQKQGTPKRINGFLYRGSGCEEIKNQPLITPPQQRPAPVRPISAPDN
ncbi:MAG: hypothetical protein HY287_00265 [Planctomycetes bacterium]|nr:hypothetical protein [Planctomycetota bacterium]MBI3832746.1 hypothetical protein [Planctomycetota bacterium]